MADFLSTIFIFMIITSFVMSFMSMFGLDWGYILWAIRSTRRVRTEQEPRDHYDRWVHGHRRSCIENKPPNLRRMMTTGDSDVPRKDYGLVKGIEPWKSYYIVFVKSRRWSWSTPYIIPQSMLYDINRRTMWVRCRGFSSVGPIKIPIPLEDVKDLDGHVLDCMEAFRHSFEQQVLSDIMEDTAWDIANAMAPPLRDRTRAAEAEAPSLRDRDYFPEDQVMGGS